MEIFHYTASKNSLETKYPHYILIGRLQRDKKIEYYQYSDEKIKYEIE